MGPAQQHKATTAAEELRAMDCKHNSRAWCGRRCRGQGVVQLPEARVDSAPYKLSNYKITLTLGNDRISVMSLSNSLAFTRNLESDQ